MEGDGKAHFFSTVVAPLHAELINERGMHVAMLERCLRRGGSVGEGARSAAELFVGEGFGNRRYFGGALAFHESGGVDVFLRPVKSATKGFHQVLRSEGEDGDVPSLAGQDATDVGQNGVREIGGEVEGSLLGPEGDEVQLIGARHCHEAVRHSYEARLLNAPTEV